MPTEVISLYCFVCSQPINWRIDMVEETIDAQVAAVASLPIADRFRYEMRLEIALAEPAVYERLPDGGVAICEACHALGMVFATQHIEPSKGLLEWVWHYLNDTLTGILESHPGRGFSGDDGFDDYKGIVSMLAQLAQAYFASDMIVFREYLDEGPQYIDDPRRDLLVETGVDPDDVV